MGADSGENFGQRIITAGIVERKARHAVGERSDAVEVARDEIPIFHIEQKRVAGPCDQPLRRTKTAERYFRCGAVAEKIRRRPRTGFADYQEFRVWPERLILFMKRSPNRMANWALARPKFSLRWSATHWLDSVKSGSRLSRTDYIPGLRPSSSKARA